MKNNGKSKTSRTRPDQETVQLGTDRTGSEGIRRGGEKTGSQSISADRDDRTKRISGWQDRSTIAGGIVQQLKAKVIKDIEDSKNRTLELEQCLEQLRALEQSIENHLDQDPKK